MTLEETNSAPAQAGAHLPPLRLVARPGDGSPPSRGNREEISAFLHASISVSIAPCPLPLSFCILHLSGGVTPYDPQQRKGA